MGYIVVSECTDGGYTGFRTWITYQDQTSFQKTFCSDTNKVIAENVTAKTAMDLTALTPPAARFLAAIEDAYNPNSGTLDLEVLKYYLHNAYYGINYDLGRVLTNSLKRTQVFIPSAIEDNSSDKYLFISTVHSMITNDYGELNPDETLDVLTTLIDSFQ